MDEALKYVGLAILVPIVVMIWVVTAVVCRMAWKDFFRD
jgi:uncharacterized membrane protein